MQVDESEAGRDPRWAAIGSERCRSARVSAVFWNRRRIGIVLTLLVLVPWLPTPMPVPTIRPTRRLRADPGDYLMRIAFAPDGRSLATADIRGRVVLHSLGEEAGSGQDLGERGHGRVIAFAPGGRFLLMAGDSSGILRCDLSLRLTTRPPGIDAAFASELKVAPDGQTLAVATWNSHNIVICDISTGRVRMALKGHGSAVTRLAFAPDGRSLASAAARDRYGLIWDLNPRPRPPRNIPTPPVLALAYSPDGTLLASAGDSEPVVRIWAVRPGAGVGAGANEPVRIIAGYRLPVRALAFSPDGTLLATAAGNGSASLWSVATGRERCRLETHASILTDIAFSPDGHTLAAAANDAEISLWDLSRLGLDQVGSE